MTLKKLFIPLLLIFMVLLVLYEHTHKPVIPSSGNKALDNWRAKQLAVYLDDFGQLNRYRANNDALKGIPANDRVIFFGDSIFDFWKLEGSFPDKSYINRGIGGQTTSQMVVRFRQDVIELKPKIVVILASSNDIAGNTGLMTLADMQANYETMYELAREHNVRVIFVSMIPVHNYLPSSRELLSQRPMARIREVNEWLKAYSAKQHIPYVDCFSALLDEHGLLRKELADDGLHPNAEGYKIIAPLIEAAIEQKLKSQ